MCNEYCDTLKEICYNSIFHCPKERIVRCPLNSVTNERVVKCARDAVLGLVIMKGL